MSEIKIGNNILNISAPVVMAIINVTPDSFFSGSRTISEDTVREKVRCAAQQGASIMDVGGYSSRPGAADVTPEEELRRVCVAVGAIREEYPDMPVSVDTFRSLVAEGVVSRFGACIINDISAGELDPHMIDAVSQLGVPYIAMHMRGTPANMQSHTDYADITSEVVSYLSNRVELARRKGINDIIVDPGFGFAKTTEQNYELLGGLGQLKTLGCPVLAGLSRKSMIYNVLGVTPEESLAGTVALDWECLLAGADILRVHDVREASDTIKLFNYYRKYGKL